MPKGVGRGFDKTGKLWVWKLQCNPFVFTCVYRIHLARYDEMRRYDLCYPFLWYRLLGEL